MEPSGICFGGCTVRLGLVPRLSHLWERATGRIKRQDSKIDLTRKNWWMNILTCLSKDSKTSLGLEKAGLKRGDIKSHFILRYNTVTADLINLKNQIIIQRGGQESGKHLPWTHKLSGGPEYLFSIKMISIETEELWWTRHCTRARYAKLNGKQSPIRSGRQTGRNVITLPCGTCFGVVTLLMMSVGIRGERKVWEWLGRLHTRGDISPVSPKIICNFQKKEDSEGPGRQREDSEQKHRGIKKMVVFIKGFKWLDHTLSTAQDLVVVELILWDKCSCVNANWTSTPRENKRKSGE